MKILFSILFVFSFLISQSKDIPTQRVRTDTTKAFSTNYGTLDTAWHKSRERHTRPTQFDSLLRANKALLAGTDSVYFKTRDSIFNSVPQWVNGGGTISVTTGDTIVTGSGTNFLSVFVVGQQINILDPSGDDVFTITNVVNNGLLYIGGSAYPNDGGSGISYQYYDTLQYNTSAASFKYKNGSLIASGDTSIFPLVTTENMFLYYPSKASLMIGKNSTLIDSTKMPTGSFNLGINNSNTGASSLIIGQTDTNTAQYARLHGLQISNIGDYADLQGQYIYNKQQYSVIRGSMDSNYSTASLPNFILGNNNTIGRTNPTGTYGNWLFGQYLRSENIGLWAFGADDEFEKKIIPFEGSIVFVNEEFTHWLSNPLAQDEGHSFGWQSPHVKDSVRFEFFYAKRGSATDAVANGSFELLARRGFTVVDNATTQKISGGNYLRYFSINYNNDDAIHFNSGNTSGRPFAPIYIDSGHFIVLIGYVDADSFKLNGTTFLNSTTMNLGTKTISSGAITSTGASSFGSIGTLNSVSSNGDFGVPLVVDTINYTVSSSIGATTIAGNATGWFRVNYSLKTSTADAGAGTVQFFVTSNDGGAITDNSALVALTATTNRDRGTFLIFNSSGNIQYYTTVVTGGTSAYNLRVWIERVL